MSGRRFIHSSGEPVATSAGSAGNCGGRREVRAQRLDRPGGQHGEPLFLAHEVGLGERQARGDAPHLRLGLRQVEAVRTAGIEARGQDPDVVLLVRELLAPQRKPLARADQREPGLRGLGDDRELRVREQGRARLDPPVDGVVLVPQRAEEVDLPAGVEARAVGVRLDAAGRERVLGAELRLLAAGPGRDGREPGIDREPRQCAGLVEARARLRDRRVGRERAGDDRVEFVASEPGPELRAGGLGRRLRGRLVEMLRRLGSSGSS